MSELKIEAANERIKDYIKNREEKGSWKYQDYVIEDRFKTEIKADGADLSSMSVDEIVDYSIDSIYEYADNKLFI